MINNIFGYKPEVPLLYKLKKILGRRLLQLQVDSVLHNEEKYLLQGYN